MGTRRLFSDFTCRHRKTRKIASPHKASGCKLRGTPASAAGRATTMGLVPHSCQSGPFTQRVSGPTRSHLHPIATYTFCSPTTFADSYHRLTLEICHPRAHSENCRNIPHRSPHPRVIELQSNARSHIFVSFFRR